MSLTVIALMAAALGICARYQVIYTDFWLDEIMSLNLIGNLTDVSQIFSIFHDNNHILNSIQMLLIGKTPHWYLYRIMPLISGVLSILFVALISFRHRSLKAPIVLILFSSSYLMVLYATEARGYSSMILFSLIAFYFGEDEDSFKNWRKILIIWISVALGFLSHFTFLHFYVAFVIWTAVRAKRGRSILGVLKILLKLHVVPIAGMVCIYFVYIQHLPPGSGPLASYADILVNTISMAVGGTELSEWRSLNQNTAVFLLSAGVLAILFSEIILIRKTEFDLAIFYIVIIFIAPLASLLLVQPRVLFPRYLLESVAFSYFLIASFLERMSKRTLMGSILAFGLIAAFCYGNGVHIFALKQDGRGHYLEALQYIADHSKGEDILIRGDQDFRNSTVINYYKPFVKTEKHLHYLEEGAAGTNEATWMITQSQDTAFNPASSIDSSIDGKRRKYVLITTYPSAALSGWTWFIYCMENYL